MDIYYTYDMPTICELEGLTVSDFRDFDQMKKIYAAVGIQGFNVRYEYFRHKSPDIDLLQRLHGAVSPGPFRLLWISIVKFFLG